MIITFASQKGGTGKTTLAIAFANYISAKTKKKINVFDFDYQKSLYHKWKEDEMSDLPSRYDVQCIGEEEEELFADFETILRLKENEEINLFDLAGTLDSKYIDLLIYSDYIIIPFEYSDVSAKSTMVFINFLGLIESQASLVFIRSKYEKHYKYLNQTGIDEELFRLGKLLQNSVLKKNCLETINTRKLSSYQNNAVKNAFEELISYIEETTKFTV